MTFLEKNRGLRAIFSVSHLYMIASVVFCYFFQIRHGFLRLFGDQSDTVIETALLHHWYNVLFFHEKWNEALYFYPYHNTLGYNDSYFLFGLIYALVFSVIHNAFLSQEIVGIILHAIGFYSMYFLLSKVIKYSRSTSLFVSSFFVVSNSIFIQASSHMQIMLVFFVPTLISIFYQSLRSYGQKEYFTSFTLSLISMALYASCFLTGYYISWFSTLFLCIFVTYLVIFSGLKKTFSFIKEKRLFLLTNILSFSFFIIPFLYIYLPKIHETGMHSWGASNHYLLKIYNLFNISSQNIYIIAFKNIYNSLVGKKIFDPLYYHYSEKIVGITPIVFILSIVGLYWSIRQKKPLLKALAFSIITLVFLSIKLGPLSPWHIVYSLVPGAKGLRVVERFLLFAIVPLCVILSYSLERVKERKNYFIYAFLLFSIVLEQANFAPVYNLHWPSADKDYQTTNNRDEKCRVFYMKERYKNENDEWYSLYHANVAAMLYAELYRIPTIIGFSTFTPSDWDFFAPYDQAPHTTPIDQRVLRYIHAHHIPSDNVCSLNISRHQWE